VVLGGKGDQLVVELLGVGAGQPAEAGDGGPADAGQPPGLAGAAAVGDVGQDGLRLLRREPGVEQRGALALGEASLAGPAVEQAALVGAVAGADGQVAGPAPAVVRAVRLEATETAEVVHGRTSWNARAIHRMPGYGNDLACSTVVGHHHSGKEDVSTNRNRNRYDANEWAGSN
jgi:hypothetical protein